MDYTNNRDQNRSFLFVINFSNSSNLFLSFSGVVQIGNDGSDHGFTFNQSHVIYTSLKKNLKQICYCYDSRERSTKLLLFKKFITNRKLRVWSRFSVQSITSDIY